MPLLLTAPANVTFTNRSSAQFTSFLWTFGDGDTSTDENPTHTYEDDGTYVVGLTATSSVETVTFTDIVVIGAADTGWTQPAPAFQGCPGYDPQVMLRTSNDGGKTWVSERIRSAGKAGEYLKRIRWNRCGSARRRVFEVSVSDPVPWRIVGAYLTPHGIPKAGGR